MNVMAICAGYGGIELGLHLATSGTAAAICYVERDANAAKRLVKRMAEGFIAEAPVWSDLRTFDPAPWAGLVDCITAGFPCQPFSAAGDRQGVADSRWLWPDIARTIAACSPSLVFFENVPGLRQQGLRDVLSDLTSLGFNAEWDCFPAAAVGAAHRRHRIWVLGYSNCERLQAWIGALSTKETFAEFNCSGSPLGAPSPRCEAWPDTVPEPAVWRASNGVADWMDRVHLLGNGVVPLAAAYVFRALTRRAMRARR